MPSHSTNPFEDDEEFDQEEHLDLFPPPGRARNLPPPPPPKASTLRSPPRGSRRGTNPFDDPAPIVPSPARQPTSPFQSAAAPSIQTRTVPIFASRSVEWPIPSTLTHTLHAKLWIASQKIHGSDASSGIATRNAEGEECFYALGDAAPGNLNANQNTGHKRASAPDGGSGSYSMSGLWKTLLPSAGNASDKTPAWDTLEESALEALTGDKKDRIIRSPNPRCVACSNGWIVSVMECEPAPVPNLTISTEAQPTTKPAVLRLVSRWNVLRGEAPNIEDVLLPLPSPVAPKPPLTENQEPLQSALDGIFIDPTGHHVVISARNGELYHLHSSSRIVRRLKGFGPLFAPQPVAGTEGPLVANLHRNEFVTAIAWDHERGTEGSTKRILLGTSQGRIYQYGIAIKGNEGRAGPAAGSTPSPMDDTLAKRAPVDSKPPATTANVKTPTNSKASTKEGAAWASAPVGGGPVCIMDLNTLSNDDEVSSLAHEMTVGAVTGLHFERLVGGRILVLAATSGALHTTRLFTFCSAPNDPTFKGAFQTKNSTPDESKSTGSLHSVVELPGHFEFSALKVCQDSFALQCSSGVYCGTINTKSSRPNLLLSDTCILPYPKGRAALFQKEGKRTSEDPVQPVRICSIALTPHHIITVDVKGFVSFVNRVSQKVVQHEQIDLGPASREWKHLHSSKAVAASSPSREFSTYCELLMDPRRVGQIWLRQARALLHISSMNEDRMVWRYTLERCLNPSYIEAKAKSLGDDIPSGSTLSGELNLVDAEFERAKTLCSTKAQKSLVDMVRGEYLLASGRADIAARYLSQAPSLLVPFSKTALRLCLPSLEDLSVSYGNKFSVNEGEEKIYNAALEAYLTDKLRLGINAKDSVVSAMLGAWLVELHMHSNDISSKDVSSTKDESSSNTSLATFLSSFAQIVDAQTVMRILQSHDIKAADCAAYAATSGDLGSAINAALSARPGKEGAQEALRVLNETQIEQAEPFYYKNAYSLMCRAPLHSCKSFLSRYPHGLQPTKILPSLMAYENRRRQVQESKDLPPTFDASDFCSDANAVIKYLEGVIKLGCQSVAIYNYLVSLYADLDDEGPLFRFLTSIVPSSVKSGAMVGTDGGISGCPLDVSFALRRILKTGRHFRSAVKLFMGFGLRQQAVELALKVDPTLARELARESVGKDERKRLWLMIARNAAAEHLQGIGKNQVAKVVSVLKDCGPDVLSIEDVLPFLPDFAQIDEFKDEICEALTSYSSKIDQYLQEMTECDHACNALRDEIARLQKHEMRMKATAICALSKVRVLDAKEPFYVFPSGYVILESALKKEVIPHLDEKQRKRVKEVEQELMNLRKRDGSGYVLSAAAQDHLENLQAELNGLIAAECPLTGSLMVNSLDLPFTAEENDSNIPSLAH